MKFSGLSSLLSKVLDSQQSGLLKKVLTGAGLTFGSTAVVTTLVNQYIERISTQTNSLPHELIMILGLSKMDYALSVVLSAVTARALMNSSGVLLKKK